jgi:xanthine dehydrogenase accessory factor
VDALADHRAAQRPCVVVTLVSIEGSSPREPGAKMVVTDGDATGTLGGGTVEHVAQERAREMLRSGETAPSMEDFTLNDAIDQACGGRMSLLFEPVRPAPFHIGLFGAGHVGQAVVRVLADVDCRIHWVDSRPEVFPGVVPGNTKAVISDNPAGEVQKLPSGTFVIAMTHSHDTDLDIVDAALRSSAPAFVGTIGSKTKRGRFRSRLAERGLSEADIDRLVIPIGIPGVGGKHPAEIGIAVAAQLLQRHGERQSRE